MIVPAGLVNLADVVDHPWIASLKVAVTLAVRLTAVAAAAGVFAVTVGAGPVVKVQVTVVRGAPAVSRMAVGPPVRVTVYLVSLARAAVGLRVHWLAVVVLCVGAAAAITVPAGFFSWNVDVVTPVTASLKVAVGVTPVPTETPFTPGVCAVTVGAALVTGGFGVTALLGADAALSCVPLVASTLNV